MQETNREQRPERALLVEVDTGEYDAEASLAELYELTRSAGAEPFGAVTQKRPAPDAASCVGSGMLEEIASHCKAHEIDLLIFDCELSPTQIRNVEDACGVRVVDRTMLILDIFAARARSREGKLQVELAQLRYLLPRLSGAGKDLSRLGGGIGTRGPGETKLETDRRHIRRRIATLREQLAVVERHRSLIRTRREKDGVMTVALVGYTNAGKSTLMNRLTEAGVLAEDILCHARSHLTRAAPAERPDGDADRHRRPGATPAAPARAGVPLHARAGRRGGRHPEPVRRLEPGGPHPSGRDKRPACGSRLRRSPRELRCSTSAISAPACSKRRPSAPPCASAPKRARASSACCTPIEEALPEQAREITVRLPFSQGALAARLRREGKILSEEYEESGLWLQPSPPAACSTA